MTPYDQGCLLRLQDPVPEPFVLGAEAAALCTAASIPVKPSTYAIVCVQVEVVT